MGTFCGLIISDVTNLEESPLWTEIIGITAGCLLGILIPKLIEGSSSDTHGINRILAKQALLGNMEKDELKQLVVNETTYLEYYMNSLFDKIDSDNSNSLEIGEIKNYLRAITG